MLPEDNKPLVCVCVCLFEVWQLQSVVFLEAILNGSQKKYPVTDTVSSALCGCNPTSSIFNLTVTQRVWEPPTLTTLGKKTNETQTTCFVSICISNKERLMSPVILWNCVCLGDSFLCVSQHEGCCQWEINRHHLAAWQPPSGMMKATWRRV